MWPQLFLLQLAVIAGIHLLALNGAAGKIV
jgi:hypothetical protein